MLDYIVGVLHVGYIQCRGGSQHRRPTSWQLGCFSTRCNRLPAVSAAESSSHGPWSPGPGPVGPVAPAASAFKVSNKGPHSPSLVSRHAQVRRLAKRSRNHTQTDSTDSTDSTETLTLAGGTNSSSMVPPLFARLKSSKIHPDSPVGVDCPSVGLASSAAASLAAASPSSLYLAQRPFGMRSTMK